MKNNETLKLSLTLAIIALVVTLLLAFANMMTKDKITLITGEKENAARKEVLPIATEFSEVKDLNNTNTIVTSVYKGLSNKDPVGYAVNVSPKGYGGEINMIVGFDKDLKVTGVKIIQFSETPGLGSKANEDAFKSQYKNKTPPVSVIKSGTPKDNEIVAISGATISSRAVTNGINAAAEAVKSIK